MAYKQKINNILPFYRPEDVSDPTKTKHFSPRFRALDGKVEAFVEALTEIAETVRERRSGSLLTRTKVPCAENEGFCTCN